MTCFDEFSRMSFSDSEEDAQCAENSEKIGSGASNLREGTRTDELTVASNAPANATV